MTDLEARHRTGGDAGPEPGVTAGQEREPGWSVAMMIDPEFARDPRPFFHRLRAGGPARDDLQMPGKRPSIYLSRFQDVEHAFRNPALFSSEFGEGLGGLGNDRPLIPLQIDPPNHKKYRVLLDPYFAPRRMALMDDEVAALVNQLIDGFEAKGGCDFTTDFAVPLPCTVFLRLVGLPLEDLDFLLHVKEGIIRGYGHTSLELQAQARAAAGRECYDYFERVLDDQTTTGRGGLLADLLAAEVDGERLTRDEILDICFLFIIAGLDTVTDSLCCFWSHLATHPDHRRLIVDDPALIPTAIEELLRWESPVSAVARVAAQDGEVGGCPVHRGDNILLFVGAANTDETALTGADGVDFTNPVARHYAFGGGIHRCLGSHLARLELRVAMREWHRRIPSYRIEDGAELTWTPMLRSVHHMPLVFG